MEFIIHSSRSIKDKHFLLFVLFLGLFSNPVFGQEFIRIGDFDQVERCTGVFTDNGGPVGDHLVSDGLDTITICSNSGAPDMTHIRLTFTAFEINGQMAFFNGEEATDENLFNVLDDQSNGDFIVQEASAANPSGCLTVVYAPVADAPGWEALISCERACQPVRAVLASSTPEVMPADTGYIDVCIGDEFTLVGMGEYPESGVIYEQSDDQSTFVWNFDDGTTAEGTTVTHSYDQPGGYTVQLRITDQNDCSNINMINQRVRVAPKPNFTSLGPIENVICIGDTVSLTASTQFDPRPNSNIFVTTEGQSFSARQQLSDSIFLPDGTGTEYTTTLEFSNFGAGQVLADPQDLEAICLNMEHSYIGDLDIWIECPNGTIADLVTFGFDDNLAGQFLGEPIDQNDMVPGIGYDYCFNSGAMFTWDQAVDELDLGGGESLPAGDYAPIESLNSLVGCPLNGEWTLHVRDNLAQDNGFIFSWGLEFNDNLFPDLETFEVGFSQASFWQDTDMIFFSADSIAAVPTAAGQVGYSYLVTDDFGCVADTVVEIEVLPFSHPNCFDCPPLLDVSSQVINTLPGTEVPTTLASSTQIDTAVLFRASENDPFGQSLYSNFGRAYESTITVNSVDPEPISSIDQVQAICVNLNTESVGGVRLFLMTPNDQLFELSTGNGGQGANFTNTCFTPDAITSIQDGTAPFTGEFLPEGNFSTLIGATVNGDWTIVAWSVSSGAPLGEFIDWSIEFRHEIPLTYSWSPAEGLSCTDCPNPVVTAGMENALYTVTVTNDTYGCEEVGTVMVNTNVTIDLMLTGTDLVCNGDSSGTASVVASAGTEPYTYVWSNGDMTADITNLEAGTYTVTVTDVNGNTQEGSITIGEPDALVITNADVANVSCNGASDGSIDITIAGGTGPLSIVWNDELDSEDLENIGPGTYVVVVTDSVGCSTTAEYEITQPDALIGSLEVTSIACGSMGAGAIDLTVMGGTEPYTFLWDNGSTEEDLDDLEPGTYCVTVTDANGCTFEICGEVTQPAELIIDALITNLACAGDESGAIDITVMGGTDPYTFAWSNDSEEEDQTGLAAGEYMVTVTDGNGCSASQTFTVTEPDALELATEVTDLGCAGDNSGSIDLTITGGTGAYTIVWNDEVADEDLNGIPAGTYTVVVTDENDCSATTTVEVTEPEALELSVMVTNIACGSAGTGSIDLTVEGGTPDYMYAWSNNTFEEDLTEVPAGDYTVTVTDANGCQATIMTSISQPAAILLTAVETDLACNNDASGAIDLTVEGGTEPYRYDWADLDGDDDPADRTGLAAGTYNVAVTDANGCSESLLVTITQPEELVATVSGTDLSCNADNSGTIDLTIVGGTGTYQIEWSDGVADEDRTNLPAGDYGVTVTDENGCSTSAFITLNEPEALVVTLVGTDLACNGDNSGAIDLTIEGGTPPSSIIWSNGSMEEDQTGLAAGTYSVTVTDINGCETSASTTLSEPAELELSATATDALCAGEASGSIILEANGGTPPYTVLWNTGSTEFMMTNITAGEYIAVVTDANGCSITSATIVIGEPSELTCAVEITAESFNGDDGALSGTAEGGTPPYTYLWSNGATTADIDGLSPGTYTLTTTDANGCTTTCSALLRAFVMVGDKVFFDINRDGIQDENESGIDGIQVTIVGLDGSSESTVTADGGMYKFSVLPGDYNLIFGRPNGFEGSPMNATTDDLDSDIDPVTLTTDVITLVVDNNNFDVDAGFFDPCIPGLSSAGLIADDQELCGPGNTPELLTEVAPPLAPANLEGTINYMWMMTTGDPAATPVNNWTPIPNSNTVDYQPGVLFETTYFARCVRIDECPFLESNIVEIFVGDDASADIVGPTSTCEFQTVIYTAENLGATASVEWNISGPVNVTSSTANSITINWGSFGRFTVNLVVTENGCTATRTMDVFVARNCGATSLGNSSNENNNVAEEATNDIPRVSRVFPNPTTASDVRLELVSGYAYGSEVRLQIFDATGRQLTEQSIQGGQRVLSLDALKGYATGLYLIRLTQGEASEIHRLILR